MAISLKEPTMKCDPNRSSPLNKNHDNTNVLPGVTKTDQQPSANIETSQTDNSNQPEACGAVINREGEELTQLARQLRHEDPVTHQPGCHIVGTGVGAMLGGATAGAAIGSILGPAGTLVGTVAGAVAGGLAGKAINEAYDPTLEIAYWRGAYRTRHYFDPSRPFEVYEHAYRLGVAHFDHTKPQSFIEAEPAMKRAWEDLRTWENEGGAPPMTWEEAKEAAKDSYERVSRIDSKDE
jgi:hypothetical protein